MCVLLHLYNFEDEHSEFLDIVSIKAKNCSVLIEKELEVIQQKMVQYFQFWGKKFLAFWTIS